MGANINEVAKILDKTANFLNRLDDDNAGFYGNILLVNMRSMVLMRVDPKKYNEELRESVNKISLHSRHNPTPSDTDRCQYDASDSQEAEK